MRTGYRFSFEYHVLVPQSSRLELCGSTTDSDLIAKHPTAFENPQFMLTRTDLQRIVGRSRPPRMALMLH